jgi:uncharacterized protein (TIGR00369 family)
MMTPVPAGLSGLQFLQHLIDTRQPAPMARTLQFRISEVSDGRAVVLATPGEHVYNPNGSVHGGYAATLLDTACGCAAHTRLSPTQAYTTLELKVAYHRPLTSNTGEVCAEGLVLAFGKRVAYTEAKLFDAARRLCASATSTLLIFDKPA